MVVSRDPGGYLVHELPALSSSIYQTTSLSSPETVFDVGSDAIALARFLLVDFTLLDPPPEVLCEWKGGGDGRPS
jgi:hypothetical protein